LYDSTNVAKGKAKGLDNIRFVQGNAIYIDRNLMKYNLVILIIVRNL